MNSKHTLRIPARWIQHLILPLSLGLALIAATGAGAHEAGQEELTFQALTLDPDFQPDDWQTAEVLQRRPRHMGQDLYHLATALPLRRTDTLPAFHRASGHRLILDEGRFFLRFHALAGAWSLFDRAAEAEIERGDLVATLQPEEALDAVRKALAVAVSLDGREHAVVLPNLLAEEREDDQAGRESILSYSVFLQSRHDGLQIVGGGAMSSGAVSGEEGRPRIVSLHHAPGDFDRKRSPTLVRTLGELLAEQEARQQLLKGRVLLGEPLPDGAVQGTITRMARAYFADGRFMHREVIPIYAYQVRFQTSIGTPFMHTYFVSALTEKGWQRLGYSAEDLLKDSRLRPRIAGIDAVPNPAIWWPDEAFSFKDDAERQAVAAFGSNHCQPMWRSGTRDWVARPGCLDRCANRQELCDALGPDPDRQYVLSARWHGLTADHIPDVEGSAPLAADYRRDWVDRIHRGFANACWRPNSNFGDNGYVSGDLGTNRPRRSDVVQAAEDGIFYLHMSHAWGPPCVNVTSRFPPIPPLGISLQPWVLPPPFVPPIPSFFHSCGIRNDWQGGRLGYFFTLSSFGNVGRRQWTQVVGGGTQNPKVVIGHVSHGNRFHFSPYAPDPANPGTDPRPEEESYPNVLSNFFANLALVDTSNPQSCEPAGMSFRAAMEAAVLDTATSSSDYGWPAEDAIHPRILRLVFSTEAQALGEHLPGWGPQFPNDNNHTGWEFLAQGSQWAP